MKNNYNFDEYYKQCNNIRCNSTNSNLILKREIKFGFCIDCLREIPDHIPKKQYKQYIKERNRIT